MMITFPRPSALPLAVLTTLVLSITACGEKAAPTICNNHSDFHGAHIGEVAQLSVNYSADGNIAVNFSTPLVSDSSTNSKVLATLDKPSQLFIISSENDCPLTAKDIERRSQSIDARYQFSCETNSKLKQFNTLLLDVLPALNEIEVKIATTAAAKHFVINRECPKSIFRF